MPDDRDRRTIKTPPAGVRAQTVKSDTWDEDTTPTPVGSTMIEQINLRSKRIDRDTQSTLTRIAEVRRELKSDISTLSTRVEGLSDHVGDLREHTAKISGTLEMLVGTLQADREERSRHAIAKFQAFTAEVEVEKTRAITSIEDEKARRAFKRKVFLKVLAGVGALWAVVSTLLIARC